MSFIFIDTRRNINRHGKLALGDTKSLDELLHQDLTQIDRRAKLLDHLSTTCQVQKERYLFRRRHSSSTDLLC